MSCPKIKDSMYLAKLAFSELLDELKMFVRELDDGKIVGPHEVWVRHRVGVAACDTLNVGHVDHIRCGIMTSNGC